MSLAEINSGRDFTMEEAYATLGQVYQETANQFSRFINVRIGNMQTSLDLTQQAFCNTWEAIAGGRFTRQHPTLPQSMHAAVFRTATNLAKNFLRDQSKRKTDTFTRAGVTEISGGMANPEDFYLQIEQQETINAGFTGLEPPQTLILQLRYLQGLSGAEIAQTLGISPGAVKSRLSRAKEALGRRITSYGQDL